MQLDESDDGRHSLESCCLEHLSVRCRLLRESDPCSRGPQSPVQSDTTVIVTSVQGGAREPQSGFPDGAGDGAASLAVGACSSWTRLLTCPLLSLSCCSWCFVFPRTGSSSESWTYQLRRRDRYPQCKPSRGRCAVAVR